MQNSLIIQNIHTILYVKDQEKSREFYQRILCKKADLFVPGMTEFKLSENFALGLMPNNGIAKIFADKVPHPKNATGIPRCELYLYVENIELAFENAINCGAKLICGIEERNWGDKACYFADNDGHIIAFAEKINE